MSKSDFISQMVEETIASQASHEDNVLSFKKPINSDTFELAYSDTRKCLILEHKGEFLEIPKNWGPFKNRFSREFSVSTSDDKYHFLSMLSIFVGSEISHAEFKIDYQQDSHKAA